MATNFSDKAFDSFLSAEDDSALNIELVRKTNRLGLWTEQSLAFDSLPLFRLRLFMSVSIGFLRKNQQQIEDNAFGPTPSKP